MIGQRFKDILLDIDDSQESIDEQNSIKALKEAQQKNNSKNLNRDSLAAWQPVRQPIIIKDKGIERRRQVVQIDQSLFKAKTEIPKKKPIRTEELSIPGRSGLSNLFSKKASIGNRARPNSPLFKDRRFVSRPRSSIGSIKEDTDDRLFGRALKKWRSNSRENLNQAIEVEDITKPRPPESYLDVGDFIRKTLGGLGKNSKQILLGPKNPSLMYFKDFSRDSRPSSSQISKKQPHFKPVESIARKLEIVETNPEIEKEVEEDYILLEPKVNKKIKECFLFRTGSTSLDRERLTKSDLKKTENWQKPDLNSNKKNIVIGNNATKTPNNELEGKAKEKAVLNPTHRRTLTFPAKINTGKSPERELSTIVARLNNLYKNVLKQKLDGPKLDKELH